MTYQERYQATTTWQARHIAKDMMELHENEQVSEQDEIKLQIAEYADANDMPFHVAAAICRLEGKRLIQKS